jgi:hypothetical protein
VSFGAATGALIPLILFGAGLWLLVKLLEAKIIVLVGMFLLTFWLARSPLGSGVWSWVASVADGAHLNHIHL